MTIKFAAIGLNHNHIYGQVDCLLRAGAELVAFFAAEDDLAARLRRKYPQAKRVADRRAHPRRSVDRAGPRPPPSPPSAPASPSRRCAHGKDVMSDKPGMTTLDQLAEIRRVQAETGRIFSICYSEHFETRSTVKAGELVAAGAIGEVVHTVGLGPHALRNNQRPRLVLRARRAMAASSATSARTSASSSCSSPAPTRRRGRSRPPSPIARNPEHPGLQDVGDMQLRADTPPAMSASTGSPRRACRPGATGA